MPANPYNVTRQRRIVLPNDPQAGALPMVDPDPTLSVAVIGNQLTFRAASNLAPAPVFYHWYVDGGFERTSTDGLFTVSVPDGQISQVTVRVTRSTQYNPAANPPVRLSRRLMVEWLRSTSDVVKYEAQVKNMTDGGEVFETFAVVEGGRGQFRYQAQTEQLQDVKQYRIRVRAYDQQGNQGDNLVGADRLLVAVPDLPSVSLSYDEGTQQVTVASA